MRTLIVCNAMLLCYLGVIQMASRDSDLTYIQVVQDTLTHDEVRIDNGSLLNQGYGFCQALDSKTVRQTIIDQLNRGNIDDPKLSTYYSVIDVNAVEYLCPNYKGKVDDYLTTR